MDWNYWIGALTLPAVIIIAVSTLALLISTDWRFSLLALAFQYIAIFILVLQFWPFEMAAAKLVAGWMAAALLGMAISNLPLPGTQGETDQVRQAWLGVEKLGMEIPAGRIVSILATALVWLVVFTFAPQVVNFVPEISLLHAFASLLLIGMGLLQLGFTSRPFPCIVALLTLLSGAELLYASVESSALVTGLLAGVTLALALVGAYLLQAPSMEEEA
jgi:hypothetical protein